MSRSVRWSTASAILTARRVLGQEYPFIGQWWRAAVIAAVLAAQVLFILFVLEPRGTDRHQGPGRALQLAGHGWCFAAPYLLMHACDRRLYRRRGQSWRLGDLLLSGALLVCVVVGSAYFYKAIAIDRLTPSFAGGLDFGLYYGLPHVLLISPLAAFLETRLATTRPDAANGVLAIRGRNAQDRLDIDFARFVYAEALQNYVTLVFLKDDRLDKQVMRATLAEMAAQLPAALRIHRSYLVNPDHLLSMEGNRRKRLAKVRFVDRPLPVSPEFFDRSSRPTSQD